MLARLSEQNSGCPKYLQGECVLILTRDLQGKSQVFLSLHHAFSNQTQDLQSKSQTVYHHTMPFHHNNNIISSTL